MQGEADALTLARATAYETTLIAMIDKLVTDLTPYNVLSPNFKPIISRIHQSFTPARTYQNNIRTALVNVANHYSGYWINGSENFDNIL